MAAGAGLLPGALPSPSLSSSSTPSHRPLSPPRYLSSAAPNFAAPELPNGEGGGGGAAAAAGSENRGISSHNGSVQPAMTIDPMSSTRIRGPATGSTERSYTFPASKAGGNGNGNGNGRRSVINRGRRRSDRETNGGGALAGGGGGKETPASVHPSILQPRVAVVLNVPSLWHPWLFALRLLSCLPAAWWGLPSALHLLLRFLPTPELYASSVLSQRLDGHTAPYALTETALATIWCFACGYLSFFFTDCLMSRWLINYTPQATIVRLLTIDVVNAYITLTTLSLAGGFQDPRLLLPGWIGIATTLTVCYHISHQRINIRKETAASINVFSIASYFSMLALLAHMLASRPDYPAMPVLVHGRRLWKDLLHFVSKVKGVIEQERAEL